MQAHCRVCRHSYLSNVHFGKRPAADQPKGASSVALWGAWLPMPPPCLLDLRLVASQFLPSGREHDETGRGRGLLLLASSLPHVRHGGRCDRHPAAGCVGGVRHETDGGCTRRPWTSCLILRLWPVRHAQHAVCLVWVEISLGRCSETFGKWMEYIMYGCAVFASIGACAGYVCLRWAPCLPCPYSQHGSWQVYVALSVSRQASRS